jgi:hypothetical protein
MISLVYRRKLLMVITAAESIIEGQLFRRFFTHLSLMGISAD